MRPALLLILLLLASLALGCGSTSPRVRREISLLRAEIVDLENQYYALKSMYRDETGKEPDFSAAGLNSGRSSGAWGGVSGVSGECLECGQIHDPRMEYDHPLTIESREATPTPAGRQPLRPGESEIDSLEEPVIEFEPEEVPLPAGGVSQGFRVPAEQAAYSTANNAQNSGPGRATRGGLVDFEIDARQTRGFDADGLPGDDGVSTRLRLDFGSIPNSSPGEVTFSVIDPEQSRENQRLGLWKYTPAEAEEMLRQGNSGGSLQVRLPWQRGPAQHENLLLFVRIRTPDGRTIERSSSFTVQAANGSQAFRDGEAEWDDSIRNEQVGDRLNEAGGANSAWRPNR